MTKKLRYLLPTSVVFLLALTIPAAAQVLPFRTYTTRDGLLSNYVLALCNDSRGYLWIATNDGLSRYDGIAFRNYTVVDGLPFSRVTSLVESRRYPGSLWIGTNGGGVCRMVDQHFIPYRVGTDAWTNSINAVLEDHTGRTWASTGRGVYVLDDTVFTLFPLTLPRSEQTNLIETPDSSVWIILDSQIYSYSPRTRQTHTLPVIPPRNSRFQASCVDDRGTIWLCTSGGVIMKVRNETVVETIVTHSQNQTFITQGDSNSFWVGVGGGILRIEEKPGATPRIQRYTMLNGLQDNMIVDGLIDREGDLWLGNYSKGISKLTDQSVATYPLHPPEFPPNGSVALNDKHDHLWACSDGSLLEFWHDENHGWTSQKHGEISKGKNRCIPQSIATDEESNLWIVSTDGRIFQYRVRRSATGVSILALVKRLVPGVHFPKSTAMFVFCDDNGLLWCSMADNQGIFLLNPKKRKPYLRRYTTADGLPDESVRAIYEDRHGNLWFGGYSDGLSMLPADESLLGKFRLFTTANGLPNGAVRAVTEDAGGTLWVGTRYGGIAFLKDSLFHTLSLKEGLLSTAVWSAARCLNGDLLIGTQLGFQTFSPAATRFLKKKEFGADPVFSCGQLSSGIIWFLSTAGLTVYDPSRDRDNPVAPPILITGFEVNGVAYPTTGAFELSNDQDNCSVEVAGISLRDEESLEYQYRLIGADDEWRPPRNNRSFVFASLAPGTYTFMARAVTSRGVVSSEPAVLRFTILLPFWRQWWFVGGTVLCLFLVALIAVRLRLSRLLALEHLRSSIATDLHDDIGSGLTRIAILSDVAYKQVQSAQRGSRSATDESAEVLGGLEKVRDTARGLIESMSDVVWAIDPSHDSFERLVQRLRSFAYELCEGRNIKLVFTVGEKVESAKMSSEGLRNVLLFSKEALTNIAKHSHCTKAELSVNLAGRRIVVAVSDNGKGFNASTVEPGNGLGNMRKRTELAGGSFKLTSKVDKGTTIVASFPLAG